MKRAILIGHDIASCQGLKDLAGELADKRKGYVVETYLANGKGFSENHIADIQETVSRASVVVLGMASHKGAADAELVTAEAAAKQNIPVFFYCDLPNTWMRPHFADFIKAHSSLIHFFVLYEESATDVKKHYPGVKAFVTGKPGWEKYGKPEHTKESARKLLGISEEEKVILCPGGKDMDVNEIHFAAVIEACSALRPRPAVILSIHGGDKNGRDAYMHLEGVFGGVEVLVPEIPRLRAPVILPAADLVVASMSTIGEEAGFQRIPTINVIHPSALQRREESTGGREWPPITLGLEDWACSPDRFQLVGILAERISLYLNPDSRESGNMRGRQEQLLVPREPGTAARFMADAVEKVMS